MIDYVSKFQDGGQADTEQQLTALAQAMIQLQQLGEAAENGDEQAKAVMQAIQKKAQALMSQEGAAMKKCGGKLKKKETGGVVSDKCGAKMKKKQVGGFVQKAKCGCKHLKRMGGKLVTVDCEGNII